MKRSAIGAFVVAVLICTAGCGEEGGCSLRHCDPCTRHEQCCVGGCRPAYELNDDGDPIITPETERRILDDVVIPTIRGMAKEGHPYVGVLYVGLMIDETGAPRVVEFNVRFGDPETQPLMVRMDGDLVPNILDRKVHQAVAAAVEAAALKTGVVKFRKELDS